MKRPATLLLAWSAIASLSCGDAARSPTQPSNAPSPALAAAQLVVRVDGDVAATAIVNVSEVTFDATGTPGDKLRFEIQFGDGESAATSLAGHVYRNPGTFTAKLTVTDAAGRQTLTTEQVVVRALQGAWFQTGINPRARRFEAHRIAIGGHDSDVVRGVYSFFGEADRTFTGRLSANRHLSLAIDDGSARFEGSIPTVLTDAGFPLVLTALGGSADGQKLTFAPVPGDPPGPAPKAVLSVRGRIPGTSGADVYLGWEATFDANKSTGDELSYLLEFGDGESVQEPYAEHAPVGHAGRTVARVVVIDRFGRVDSATQPYGVQALAPCFYWYECGWWNYYHNPVTGLDEARQLWLTSHDGRHLTGRYQLDGRTFTATFGGANEVRFALDDGTIEFTGTFAVEFLYPGRTSREGIFTLKVRGGSADGATLRFWLYEPG